MPYNFLKSVQLVLGLSVFAPLSGCITPTIKDFDNSSNLGNEDKYLAFVGELVEMGEYEPNCFEFRFAPENPDDESDIRILCEGYVTKMRFKILELVYGDYDRSFVDFYAVHQFGFPRFPKHKVAMLYLREDEGALHQTAHNYDDVYPSKDGSYAYCGNPYLSLDDEDVIDQRPLLDIKFSPPVIKKISDHLPDERDYGEDQHAFFVEDTARVRAYFSEPDFEINNGRARCKKGVYAEEMFRIQSETKYLPRIREELCAEKLGLGLYLDDSDEGRAVKACIADMKQNNLPQGFLTSF